MQQTSGKSRAAGDAARASPARHPKGATEQVHKKAKVLVRGTPTPGTHSVEQIERAQAVLGAREAPANHLGRLRIPAAAGESG